MGDLTKLTGNKPSLTALQNPGMSPGQEVLFLILSDLCMPFVADKNLNTPHHGAESRKIF